MKKIAIITGASAGMGKEFVKQVSSHKKLDEIWIIARRKDKLENLAQEINNQHNFNVIRPIQLDISGKQGALELKALLKKENEDLEKIQSSLEISLLINNAGFGVYGPFIEASAERQMDMIDLNCTSLTGICAYAIPYMNENSVIINTASLAAFMPLGNFAVYAATKAYVLSFTVALAAELKDKKIKVLALCPGSVSTEFANVASNGARKEVKGGYDPVKVVRHCLKKAYKGKKIALWAPKWKFNSFLSRIFSRFFIARMTYKFNKRPHNPDEEKSA